MKFSNIVEGNILPRYANTHQNRKCTFVVKLGQIYEKVENSENCNAHNLKPEVEIEIVPTAFITLRLALKDNVMNFS